MMANADMTHDDDVAAQQDSGAFMEQYIDENYRDTIEAPEIGPKTDDYHDNEFDHNSDNREGRDAPNNEEDRLTDPDLQQLALQVCQSGLIEEAASKTPTGNDNLAGVVGNDTTSEPVPEARSSSEPVPKVAPETDVTARVHDILKSSASTFLNDVNDPEIQKRVMDMLARAARQVAKNLPTLNDAARAEETTDETADPAKTVDPAKKRTIKEPRRSPDTKHVTSFWQVYDPVRHTEATVSLAIAGKNSQIAISAVEHYPLYMGRVPQNLVGIPSFCRLDDLTVGVLLTFATARQLHDRWPVEFDQRGMVRATRLPLGRPFKVEVKAGMKDARGLVAKPEDEGFYFGYWRGLHVLHGAEGYEAEGNRYFIRPSFETPLTSAMSWFLDKKAVIQQPSGFNEAEVWASRDPVVDARVAKNGGKASGGKGTKEGGTVAVAEDTKEGGKASGGEVAKKGDIATVAKDAKKGQGSAGGLSGTKRKALSDKDDNNDEDGDDASDKGRARKKGINKRPRVTTPVSTS